MSNPNNPIDKYKKTKVTTAPDGTIIIMLYDECIKQINNAIELIEGDSKKFDLVNNSIKKSQDIITELAVSIDLKKGGKFAETLFNLYLWFNKKLSEGNFKKDAKILKEVRDSLTEINGAWKTSASKISISESDKSNTGVNINT